MTTKPCPFCGKCGLVVPEQDVRKGVIGYFVNCGNMKCSMFVQTPLVRTKKEAIDIWNRRFK